MKFLGLLAAALVGLTQAQNATQVPCVPLNFTEKQSDIKSLNSVIDLAIRANLITEQLVTLDPLKIVENRLNSIPFSVLGMDFALTPIIKSLNATGIASIVPEHVNITGDHSLVVGANFNGTIDVDAGLSFEIAQLNKQWWQICWTSALHPIKCPPASIDVILGVGIAKPTLDLDTTINMQLCPKGLPKGTCSDVSVSNILIAARTNKLPELLTRLLKKFTNVSINDFQVTFESLTKLKFDFAQSNLLLTALFQKLLGYTADEVNKKGQLYTEILKVIDNLAKQLLNQLIAEKLAPQFGNTCY